MPGISRSAGARLAVLGLVCLASGVALATVNVNTAQKSETPINRRAREWK